MKPHQKYRIIRSVGLKISLLCPAAGVSRSGYYRWLKTADAPERDNGDYLLIRQVFDGGRGKLGSRSVQMGLSSGHGIGMNHKKVARIMRKYGLRAKIRKTNPYRAIMKRTLEHATFPNVLDRQFLQDMPYGTFCTDITYLPFNGRMAYLSAIKDLASREIVGWNLSMHLEMDIVMGTLVDMEERCRGRIASFEGTLIHSDQGFHYTNPLYSEKVSELGMVQSMSRKGTCIDNAPMESFFGHMKDDIDLRACRTFGEMRELVGNYMEHYNNSRYQWGLKKMTPVEYRDHLLESARA